MRHVQATGSLADKPSDLQSCPRLWLQVNELAEHDHLIMTETYEVRK